MSPMISNSADLNAAYELDFSEMKGPFTDPTIAVTYFSDGRLKGINATQTGVAKQVIESSLKTVASTLRADVLKDRVDDFDPCATIKKLGVKNVLTLEYSAEIAVSSAARQEISPIGSSQYYHDLFADKIGDLHAHVEWSKIQRLKPPITHDTENSLVTLTARQLSKVSFGIHTTLKNSERDNIWQGAVLMALPGNEYQIPIPKKPAFGTQEFEVLFADSGALEKLKYASTSGTNEAAGLAGTVISEIEGPSAAQEAAAIKAEADLIQQRQRLANCRLNPANC
ncbi:hypothetical protein [Roseobacter sp. EG26]|uniref:hypothetical protein n=1 Tax=Roseobacter sp. EG26 TaxID=3412477 RepID=UPI003CE51E34